MVDNGNSITLFIKGCRFANLIQDALISQVIDCCALLT
jgi:hypothetical protein